MTVFALTRKMSLRTALIETRSRISESLWGGAGSNPVPLSHFDRTRDTHREKMEHREAAWIDRHFYTKGTACSQEVSNGYT